MNRRKFLIRSAAFTVGASAGVLGYTFFVEPFFLKVTDQELPISNLPPSLVGKRLLQISDLHIGDRVQEKYLARAMSTARALDPDLVVITGDITDTKTNDFEVTKELVGLLDKPRHGIFAVLGNHDYGYRWSNRQQADQLCGALESIGVAVLRNQLDTTSGLQIIGLDDLWGPNFTADTRLPSRSPEKPVIALAHNPDMCDLNIWGRYEGWIFSGHTHGGQCKPPFLPPPKLPVRNRRYTKGIFKLDSKRMLHVSPGVGFLFQVRFLVRPELNLFRLKAV